MRVTARTAIRTTAAVGVVAALTGAFLLLPGGPGVRPAAAAGLTPFADCTALQSWFADAASSVGTPYGPPIPWGTAGAAQREMPAPQDAVAGVPEQATSDQSAAGGLDAPAVGPGATGTNVQEVGVDEPDLLKTDGERLVAVRGEKLHVLDVTGSTPRELGSLAMPTGAAGELLLSGDRALVLGTAWTPAPFPDTSAAEPAPDRVAAPMIAPSAPSAVLTVVDLGDPTAPSVVSTHEIEGGYVSAREHNGVVRVVLQSMPWRPFQDKQPTGASAQDWLPQRIDRDATGQVMTSEPLLDCADVSHPARPAGLGVVTVLTVDVSDPTTLDSVAVAADGDLVYASTARLYVATTRGGWARPVEPESWGGGAEPAAIRTQLHAFDVTPPTTTAYVGSGEVEGWLLGRWAMSEHEGRLRVATTRGQPWATGGDAPGTDSAVTVLEERGDELQAVGSVGGLGQGEQIRAVRWFGDVATVVTFRQTDPLYTVDLADPANPRVLGELKVPGYSAYLHPLDDGLLLGVGQDATDDGQVLGTQVATFDLSDLAAPSRVDTFVEAESWSDVESDSRLFTYLPEQRTALLPVSGPTGSQLLALQIDDVGDLTEGGRWAPGRDGWIVRGLPVGGGRLVVLDEGVDGATLTLVTVNGLAELGSTRLA